MENTNNQFGNARTSLFLDRLLLIGLILFIIGLPFHLVVKRIVIGPAGTYWKEVLLFGLVVIWIIRSIIARRPLLTQTILDWAILIYAGYIVIRLLLDGFTPAAWWGFYISILYLPLVFIVPIVLRRFTESLWWIMGILVGIGGILALGGVIEFLVNRPLWPSSEFIIRQGFPDVFIYGTQIRRVYFVLDSPTTLANTLAILLPIALVLLFSNLATYQRVLSGVSAVLIFACILLTFSRGIWIALFLSAIAVLVFKLFVERNRKALISGFISVVVAFSIFVIVIVSRSNNDIVDRLAIELSKESYGNIPQQGSSFSLLEQNIEDGIQELQKWNLYDEIEQKQDIRSVLFAPLRSSNPTSVSYRVSIPNSGALLFAIAFNPETWSANMGDGVNFKITVREQQDQENERLVFQRYLNPKLNPGDRRWHNYLLDLSDWGGKTVDLTFITESGPQGDFDYDWAGWADLTLTEIPGDTILENSKAGRNPTLAHVLSIADWKNDATNRDRISAWRTGFANWLRNPFWGNGLGTTGVASFRAIPEKASVTESQFLKSLVELGIIGFIVLLFLWFTIGRFAFITYKKVSIQEQRILFLGILCSLFIIFIESLVYQNLEVKQVNALFWILIGVLSIFNSKNVVPSGVERDEFTGSESD